MTTTKTLSTLTAMALLAGVAATGCRQDDDEGAFGTRDGRDPVAVTEPGVDDAMRSAKLEQGGIPADVRIRILRDIGDLPVTSANARITETGVPVYRVVYIVEGEPYERWYGANGDRINPPAGARPAEPTDPETARGELPPATPE